MGIMELKLLKLSFTVSLIAIIILFFICEFSKINVSDDLEIDDDIIKIIGIIENTNKGNNVTFISLRSENTIDIIAFDDVNISQGSRVEIIASSDDDSLIASRIRVI